MVKLVLLSQGDKTPHSNRLTPQASRVLRWMRSRFLQHFTLVVLSFVCAITLAACKGSSPLGMIAPSLPTSSGNSSPTEVTTLRVALDPTFPPFQSKVSEGKFEGFDIDLINAIAEVEGLELDLEALPFDVIIPALQSKSIDLTISTMTITPERSKVIDFSQPYFKSGQAIAVQKTTTDIRDEADLKGKTVGVQMSSVSAEKANTIEGVTVRNFEDVALALKQLTNGSVDAVISDAPVILYAIKNGSANGIKLAGEWLTEEYYGIAAPKDSPNLEKINAGLATLIENGRYKEIYQKWFSGEPPQLPEKAPL